MYYELFSCSDVGHLPCFQSFWCFKQYCVAIIIHTPCAHAGVFLRYQEVDLLGHWMWVRHFTIFCPVVLQSGCTNLHTWVRVSVCILLTFCIADFNFLPSAFNLSCIHTDPLRLNRYAGLVASVGFTSVGLMQTGVSGSIL